MTDKPASQNMSDWLKIMLQEIDRKSDEQLRAETEQRRRSAEAVAPSPEALSNKTSSKVTSESRR